MSGDSGALARNQVENYGDLRGWIARVDALGELLRVSGAHWDAEMGSITQILT